MRNTARTPVDPSAAPAAEAGGAFIERLPDDAFGHEALSLAEQSAGIGVWSIDLATGLVRATAQFFRTMGLEPTTDRVPISAIRALRHPDDRDRVVDGFRHALDGGVDSYENEYRIIRPDGQVRWIFGRGRVVRGPDGKPQRYSGVDLDITERKAAEAALAAAKVELERMNQVLEQRVRERTEALETEAKLRADTETRLHQAQKMEAVGQLTGGIAHDFNNILQVILGNLEIARYLLQQSPGGHAPPSDTVVRAIETAQRASRSAGQLVQRMLVFSRMQKLEPASLDVNALISGMHDMVTRTLGETIAVSTGLAPGLWPTFVDRNQLESALLNLVVNARDAMPNGGSLSIETANVEITGSSDSDVAPGQYVVIDVRDTGCGIPKELLDKVFEPFFTTKEVGMGSGLGLSMVYGFAKQSRGHVRLESEVGAGSSVRIYLPRSTHDAPMGAAEPSENDSGTQIGADRARDGETVILVEDNDQVRNLGVSALENLGYRVLEASDGRSALAILDTAEASRVDLLFTDVVLPGGMSGPELAAAATARRPGMSVLFTSGYTRNAMAQGSALAPDVRVLKKPYALQQLARAIRRAIDEADGDVDSAP